MDSRIRNTSARLSSTIRICRRFVRPGCSDWDCEPEDGSLAGVGFDPDSAMIPLHDALANRQSNTRSRVFVSSVQAFEEPKDVLPILGFNANSIIAYRKHPDPIPTLG